MKVLVTGGAGFIGSHVVDSVLATGHEVRIFDLVPSPYHDPREVEMVVGDIADSDAREKAVAGCDMIAHLAAISDVNDVVDDPLRAEAVNARGTALLLEAARAHGVIRFVYASTIWVYGNARGVEPLDEDTQLVLPSHLYTATKLAGEMYCRSYGELYGLEHTILRFGIPYGPRSRTSTVLAAFVERALAGRTLMITGDGSQSRQFVFVEDLARGVVAALGSPRPNRIYNLVGDETTTVREIAETVRQLVSSVEIVHVDSRPGDLRSVEISSARAARELHWSADTPFAEGARRYVESVTPTHRSPQSATASKTSGRAATVVLQEPSEL
ncbi:MAG: NAD-dependent epimerase/dehydratase family protein [Actinomycetota bacterium]|nr:NAD-dependent epimerase/dehydratase family protein [Actinomycetota bacterium]